MRIFRFSLQIVRHSKGLKAEIPTDLVPLEASSFLAIKILLAPLNRIRGIPPAPDSVIASSHCFRSNP